MFYELKQFYVIENDVSYVVFLFTDYVFLQNR